MSPADQVCPAYLYSTVRNALALGSHSCRDILQDSCKGKRSNPFGWWRHKHLHDAGDPRQDGGVVRAADCPYPKPEIGGRKGK